MSLSACGYGTRLLGGLWGPICWQINGGEFRKICVLVGGEKTLSAKRIDYVQYRELSSGNAKQKVFLTSSQHVLIGVLLEWRAYEWYLSGWYADCSIVIDRRIHVKYKCHGVVIGYFSVIDVNRNRKMGKRKRRSSRRAVLSIRLFFFNNLFQYFKIYSLYIRCLKFEEIKMKNFRCWIGS